MTTFSEAKSMLRIPMLANNPAMIWGPPGVGKSALVREVATALSDATGTSFPVVEFRAPLMSEVDVHGLPDIESGHCVWRVPVQFSADAPCIIFLDEINAGSRGVQAALYELVYDRSIGGHKVHAETRIIAAGNRGGDRAIVKPLSSALSSRFSLHVDLDVSADDWCQYAARQGLAPEVIAFIRNRPATLHCFDSNTDAERPYPCPRTIEYIAQHTATLRSLGEDVDSGEAFAIYSGCAGEGWAAEYTGFLSLFRQMPDPADCIADPKGTAIPSDVSIVWALVCALAYRTDRNNVGRIVQYINRLGVEWQQCYWIDSANRTPELKETAEYVTHICNKR